MANQPFKADRVILNAGAAATPSLAIGSLTDGLYQISAGVIGVAVGGVLRLILGNSGGGFVGGATGDGFVGFPTGGGVNVTANGTNKPVTLTPSGTAPVVIGAGGFITPTAGTGILYGLGSNGLNMAGSGSTNDIAIFNKSGGAAIVVPTGTTNVLFGGLNVNGVGAIQLPAATTSAGGITLGEINIYRTSAGGLVLNSTGVTSTFFQNNGSTKGSVVANTNLQVDATGTLLLSTNGGSSALTINTSQNSLFAGSIATVAPTGGAGVWKLGKYTAGVLVQAGSVLVNIDGVDRTLLTA